MNIVNMMKTLNKQNTPFCEDFVKVIFRSFSWQQKLDSRCNESGESSR